MKSYSLELVQRKTGSGTFGKLVAVAALGAGAYVGYRRLTNDKKNTEGANRRKHSTYDAEAHDGENFTARILKAAKRVIS